MIHQTRPPSPSAHWRRSFQSGQTGRPYLSTRISEPVTLSPLHWLSFLESLLVVTDLCILGTPNRTDCLGDALTQESQIIPVRVTQIFMLAHFSPVVSVLWLTDTLQSAIKMSNSRSFLNLIYHLVLGSLLLLIFLYVIYISCTIWTLY